MPWHTYDTARGKERHHSLCKDIHCLEYLEVFDFYSMEAEFNLNFCVDESDRLAEDNIPGCI